MTSAEIRNMIENILAELPERMTGNEAAGIVSKSLRDTTLSSDRKALIACLRAYLAFRVDQRERSGFDAVSESRIWLALAVTEALALRELQPEIEALHRDVCDGMIFAPVYKSMVKRYLD